MGAGFGDVELCGNLCLEIAVLVALDHANRRRVGSGQVERDDNRLVRERRFRERVRLRVHPCPEDVELALATALSIRVVDAKGELELRAWFR